MRIYAESQPAKSPPYLHLGYIAATTIETPVPGMVGGGIFFTMVGICLIFLALIRQAVHALQHRPFQFWTTRMALFGLLAFSGGCFSYILGVGLGKTVPAHGQAHTRSRMRMVEYRLRSSFIETNTLAILLSLKPGEYDLEAFVKKLPNFQEFDTNALRDAWGHPMQMKVSGQDKAWSFSILSPGEDGRLGTKDDIEYTAKDLSTPK